MSADAESTLAGWGRLPVPGREVVSEDFESITRGMTLSRGLGRSYGDSSLPPPGRTVVAGSRLADRILAFDSETGILRAEAGLSLGELSRVFLPRGWASPVYTGTQYVTLGGMAAADVHGKNQHVDGSFGDHVQRLRMRLADDRVLWCSPEEHPDLFFASLGGMGLTGHLLEVEVALSSIPSPWILAESERIPDLDSFLEGLSLAAAEWPFTVGWIDCLTTGRHMGRGILHRGRWAAPGEAPARPPPEKRRLTVPIDFPGWMLDRWSVRMFNALYYRKQLRRQRRAIVDPESFFHPLDVLRDWNRIYGSRGFTQYQCVIPKAAGIEGVRRFFDLLTGIGAASLLSVMKDFGREGRGMLSFPMPGTTINLDLPVRAGTQEIVDRFNECVIDLGGRIYLAKDAFTRQRHFRAMEGERLDKWLRVRARWDPDGLLASAQSARILGDMT
ncbi:MAG: FAD-binding oxidoreductase [Thermoanaerobaculia bacterium]